MKADGTARWDGITRRSSLKDKWAAERDRLADAARDGDWRTVFHVLDEEPEWANSGRLEGRSGYAPLHQAAWHGADAGTVERLLEYGAFRTLRASDATRPLDIAVSRGHAHLGALLRPQIRHPLPQDVIAGLRWHLHRLIRYRSGGDGDGDGDDGGGGSGGGGSDLATQHAMRLPEVEALTELEVPDCWFPVPGMYGGFHIRLRGAELTVDSWCRVVGGSERTDRVTVGGVYLQEGERL
ncbi:ankyrin repeat domain-containing protein [Streptomyces sp. NPDC012935]|uniref:ankyrin repeat domain-containing protein n=1 Tax=Streptomyces sp. NPDC012935 TaxID=3364857 RepID=UPI0036B56EB6